MVIMIRYSVILGGRLGQWFQKLSFAHGVISSSSQMSTCPGVAATSVCPVSFRSDDRIVDCRKDEAKRMLRLTWSDGLKANYAFVWLRDNSPAHHTYEMTTSCKARKMLLADLDTDVFPWRIIFTDKSIQVSWSDERETEYSSEWLRQRNLEDHDIQIQRPQIYLNHAKLWDVQTITMNGMHCFHFEDILVKDEVLEQCLTQLCLYGFVRMYNVPSDGGLRKFAALLGFHYPTHYGDYFLVQNQASASNVAYSQQALGLHSDLPYMSYPPQVQALHCIQQSACEGGLSQFVDGFNVAKQLKEELPDVYQLLCNTPIEYVDDGVESFRFRMIHRWPVISLDESGNVEKIQFSNQQRSWFFNLPVEQLQPFYKALKTFNNYLYKPQNLLEFRMTAGEMVVFLNLRILHGRSAFKDNLGNDRKLQGCYFNLDIVKSTIRALHDKQDTRPKQLLV